MVIYYLTCGNEVDARVISDALLEARLVACIRRAQVSSSYWWEGKIRHDTEILLMMEGIEENFEAIEAVITKHHSYKEFVLTMVPVTRTTPGVLKWLDEAVNKPR